MFEKFGYRVSRMDRVRNEEVRRRAGIERELASRADQRVLRWWAGGKNGCVPYGQKGVDGGRKWRAGTRETEVRLPNLGLLHKSYTPTKLLKHFISRTFIFLLSTLLIPRASAYLKPYLTLIVI